MKLIAIGVWVVIVTLGTAYGVALYLPGSSSAKAASTPALQYTKTRVLNVPMIANGVVQGFIVMQLGYTAEASAMNPKEGHAPPEVYLLDEAFRTVYSDASIDFKNLGRFDLIKFTGHLVTAVNEHLGAPVVKDVLIEQFSYVGKDAGKT